jgi:hypothetical protein
MRFSTSFLVLAVALSPATAFAQKVPDTVKVGAKFVWHLAGYKDAKDLKKFETIKLDGITEFRGAKLDLDKETTDLLPKLLGQIRDLKLPLEPRVSILGNGVIDPESNDQFAIYSIIGATGRTMAFKVRLSVEAESAGRKPDVYITAIREYGAEEMYKDRTGFQPISLPQR